MSRFRSDIEKSMRLNSVFYHEPRKDILNQYHECECTNLQARCREHNKGRHWTIQCLDCGLCEGDKTRGILQWVKKSHPIVMQAVNYTEIDDDLRLKTKSKFYFFYRLIYERDEYERKEVLNKEWEDYTNFLNSPEWKTLRLRVLERDKYICQLQYRDCQHNAVQVHHITYKNWRQMHPQDLTSVCLHCHKFEHPHMQES